MNDNVHRTPEGHLVYGDVQQAPPSEDWGLQRAKWWKLKLCWLPRRCYLTNKPIWGKFAYHGERWITGPGEPAVEHYWIEKLNSLFGI